MTPIRELAAEKADFLEARCEGGMFFGELGWGVAGRSTKGRPTTGQEQVDQ